MNKSDLDFNTTIILDKIQKNKLDEIDKKDLKKLREQRLIEKIGKEYILSSKVAEILGKEAEYTKKKGFSDDKISNFIVEHLENFSNGQTRKQINEYVWDYLSEILSKEQKIKKINYILYKLQKRGVIKNFGTDKIPLWKLLKNKIN
jgi:ATP-dependent DNA helicase RecG